MHHLNPLISTVEPSVSSHLQDRVMVTAYERCLLVRGREYSDRPITGVWLGPTNGVRLREVSAYERCPEGV